MFSQLAKEDLDDLRAEGLAPSDEDVLLLHELGSRITNGATEQPYNMPRFAVCGGVVFHEPTVAAWEWYFFAKTFARGDGEDDWFFAFALANGRKPGFFDGLDTADAIRRAVKAFRKSIAATADEVSLAVRYASRGDAAARDALDEADAGGTGAAERESRNLMELERLMASAAAATGLTFNDLMCQTPSRLVGYVFASAVLAGTAPTKASAAAHGEYLAAMHKVADRLRKEKAERESAATSTADRSAARPQGGQE